MLTDPFFWNAFCNTFSIFLLSAIPQLIIATIIAAVLDQALRAETFWRMSILLPYIVAPVAVAVIFSQIFNQYHGPIAGLLEAFGLDPIRWTFDVFPSHVAIATMVNWRWTGYNALILLAAMQAIPRDLYESAALDGAGKARRFLSITIPMIRPTMIFVVITSTIGGLQIFTEPKLFDPRSVRRRRHSSSRRSCSTCTRWRSRGETSARHPPSPGSSSSSSSWPACSTSSSRGPSRQRASRTTTSAHALPAGATAKRREHDRRESNRRPSGADRAVPTRARAAAKPQEPRQARVPDLRS